MGDRVLMQVYNSKTGEFGPAIYCHQCGYDSPQIVRALAARMADRENDVAYASARLLQEAIGDREGNTGYGLWNVDLLLTKEDGDDAGVILIDAADHFRCTCLGGYLKDGPDGFPQNPNIATWKD